MSSFPRLKKSEKIFIHKSLLLSLGVGNLVFVLDTSLFTTRQEHAVSAEANARVGLASFSYNPGEEGLKHSFDEWHVKRTDSDLFS